MAFAPANRLREARRQKGLPVGEVPPVCVLDPDEDIVRDDAAKFHFAFSAALAAASKGWVIIVT